MPHTPTLPVAELHLGVLRRNLVLVRQNAEGLSDEQELAPLWPGGSHFNWMIGHMTHSRCGLLRTLGHEAPWSAERGQRYGAGSTPPGPAEAEPFAALLAAFEATQAPLETALSAVTAADLEAERAPGRNVGRSLEFLVWHDSYHCGQSTLYRRVLGFERVTP